MDFVYKESSVRKVTSRRKKRTDGGRDGGRNVEPSRGRSRSPKNLEPSRGGSRSPKEKGPRELKVRTREKITEGPSRKPESPLGTTAKRPKSRSPQRSSKSGSPKRKRSSKSRSPERSSKSRSPKQRSPKRSTKKRVAPALQLRMSKSPRNRVPRSPKSPSLPSPKSQVRKGKATSDAHAVRNRKTARKWEEKDEGLAEDDKGGQGGGPRRRTPRRTRFKHEEKHKEEGMGEGVVDKSNEEQDIDAGERKSIERRRKARAKPRKGKRLPAGSSPRQDRGEQVEQTGKSNEKRGRQREERVDTQLQEKDESIHEPQGHVHLEALDAAIIYEDHDGSQFSTVCGLMKNTEANPVQLVKGLYVEESGNGRFHRVDMGGKMGHISRWQQWRLQGQRAGQPVSPYRDMPGSPSSGMLTLEIVNVRLTMVLSTASLLFNGLLGGFSLVQLYLIYIRNREHLHLDFIDFYSKMAEDCQKALLVLTTFCLLSSCDKFFRDRFIGWEVRGGGTLRMHDLTLIWVYMFSLLTSIVGGYFESRLFYSKNRIPRSDPMGDKMRLHINVWHTLNCLRLAAGGLGFLLVIHGLHTRKAHRARQRDAQGAYAFSPQSPSFLRGSTPYYLNTPSPNSRPFIPSTII